MRCSTFLSLVLGASTISAAPTWPSLVVDAEIDTVSSWFEMLAEKVEASRTMEAAPSCDLSLAAMAVAPTPLPSPGAGLKLKHVAIGRGTQNYTCAAANSSAAPVQVGALATLFNASCMAASYPELLAIAPKVALQFNLTTDLGSTAADSVSLGPISDAAVSGHHYFLNTTTPFFNLDTTSMQLGEAPCTKTSASNAPADAPSGTDGSAATTWLQLDAHADATGNLQQVYRVQTAGGSAPATCAGLPAGPFEVQYAAQYWFYES